MKRAAGVALDLAIRAGCLVAIGALMAVGWWREHSERRSWEAR